MALFSYKAVNATGKTSVGQIEAINIVDLELRLKRMGLDLVVGGPSKRAMSLAGARIKRQDLINFCFHLEQMTRSGVLLTDGLSDLRDSVENPRFREIISGVLEAIQGGQSLSQSLAQYPQVFDAVFRALVRAGEETGRLPEVLKSIGDKLRWEDELAAQTKRALMYPAIVGTLVIVVIFFLMLYLVPQMMGFIKNMGQAIPLHTRVLVAVSDFFVRFWWLLMLLPFLGAALVAYLIRTNPAVRYRFDSMVLRLPVVGGIIRKIILSRFASVFALLYSSGITILDAIRSSEETAGNRVIEEGLRQAGQHIAEGKTVTAAFQEVDMFPALVIRMLRVGENTGSLDTALLNVSYFYNREVKEGIARLQVLIEPALTVVLGVLLGWVMLSVLGPIYDTISKLKI
jgi:type IV pilus assembly protein PilC